MFQTVLEMSTDLKGYRQVNRLLEYSMNNDFLAEPHEEQGKRVC